MSVFRIWVNHWDEYLYILKLCLCWCNFLKNYSFEELHHKLLFVSVIFTIHRIIEIRLLYRATLFFQIFFF